MWPSPSSPPRTLQTQQGFKRKINRAFLFKACCGFIALTHSTLSIASSSKYPVQTSSLVSLFFRILRVYVRLLLPFFPPSDLIPSGLLVSFSLWRCPNASSPPTSACTPLESPRKTMALETFPKIPMIALYLALPEETPIEIAVGARFAYIMTKPC